jgi:hypothetical protein
MKLKQLTIEELVEIRTKMILEKISTKEINSIIDEKEKEYANSILEDTAATGGPAGASMGGSVGSGGVAYGSGGIGGGMGAVVAAQPSSYAGATIGSNWSGHGGTEGSGDVSNPLNVGGGNTMFQKSPAEMGKGHGARTGKKSRVKKMDMKALRNVFAKRQDFTTTASPKKIMNFNDFEKSSVNKVTKVNQ